MTLVKVRYERHVKRLGTWIVCCELGLCVVFEVCVCMCVRGCVCMCHVCNVSHV